MHDEEGAGQKDRCSLNRRDDVRAIQARKGKSNLCDCWRINSDDGPVRMVPRAPGVEGMPWLTSSAISGPIHSLLLWELPSGHKSCSLLMTTSFS